MLSLSRIFKRCMGTHEIRNYLKNSAGGFDKVVRKVNIIEAENGICVGELLVEEEHTNPMKGLHGGLMATLVDCLTTYALLTHAKSEGIPSVSVDLNMTYVKSVSMGEVIRIKAETVKAGYTLGFTECTITNKTSGEVLAKGSHTKYLFRADRRFMTTDDLKKLIRDNKCGFDQNLKRVTFTEVGCGKCVGELQICEEHTNKKNTMHGGMAITLVDAFTTFGLLTHSDSLCIPSISIEIYLAYLRPARRGEEIIINAETIKAGNKLAFTKCLITHKGNGDILVVGYHTKYLMR